MEITQWIPTAFIITQAPLTDKFDIFWMMIWEQESEVIACLASDAQVCIIWIETIYFIVQNYIYV